MDINESVKTTLAILEAKRAALEIAINGLKEYLGETSNGHPEIIKTKRFINVPAFQVEKVHRRYNTKVKRAADAAQSQAAVVVQDQTPNEIKPMPPASFGSALKRVMRESVHPVTVDEVFNAVQTRWPSLCVDRDRKNAQENIFYWLSKSYVDKIGISPLATYKVIDQEFFKEKTE